MPEQIESTHFAESVLELIEFFALGIELLAVAIIIVAIISATVAFVWGAINRTGKSDNYDAYKERLSRALLLGLEILVAADIVRTVALEPSLENVAVLGILVLIRTFLSWSLVVEIEHRWPWQAERRDESASESPAGSQKTDPS